MYNNLPSFQNAVIDITYTAVEKMRKDKGGYGGTIVNVASVAGLVCFMLKYFEPNRLFSFMLAQFYNFLANS